MAKLEVIAQNFDIYSDDGLDQSARTGDISLRHLNNAGAQGVILSHSEVDDVPVVVNKKLLYIYREQQSRLQFCENTILIG